MFKIVQLSGYGHAVFSYIFIFFLLFLVVNVDAQERKAYTVEWVSEYPSTDSLDKKSFKERISNILFGKKNDDISKPFGVYAENKDNYWILDQGRGTLFHVVKNKRSIPVALTKQKIAYPSLTGICMMQGNKLLFTDSRLNKIFVLSADQKEIKELNDTLTLYQPTGIAWSERKGEIWVVETKAHRISVFDSRGRLIRRIGKRGTGNVEFNYPTFIWIDESGNVYIVDSMNFRLQLLDSEGNYITSFGKVGDASGYFARPKGIAVDKHGNIYVADALYNAVQIYDKEGNFLYYFGSQGHGKGQFWMPAGIFIDKDDFIYVADNYNARIQIFKLKEK